MTKILIAATAAACAFATIASADAFDGRPSPDNLASMNLTPTKVVSRDVPTRNFTPDETPTSFNYALPAPGMGAIVGYKPSVDTHPIQSYEVNEATAIGFSQPSSSVGAAIAYKF